jgi:hypothetical protein
MASESWAMPIYTTEQLAPEVINEDPHSTMPRRYLLTAREIPFLMSDRNKLAPSGVGLKREFWPCHVHFLDNY